MADTPLNSKARDALGAFASRTAREPSSAQLAAIWERAATPRRNALPLLAVALVAATLAAFVLWHRPAPLEVVAQPGAQWTRSGDAVALTTGRVTLRSAQTLTVTTPHLSAELTNAAALFDVTGDATSLLAESGDVQWRSGKRSGRALPGVRITVAPEDPSLALGGGEACGGAVAARCEEQASRGSGLAAQTALYGLALAAHDEGRAADAARLFASYEERFPNGAFTPEASIGLMRELRALGRADEAAGEAARFLKRFPADVRAGTVKLWARPPHSLRKEE